MNFPENPTASVFLLSTSQHASHNTELRHVSKAWCRKEESCNVER
jgi:hypothetical protein